MCLNCIWTLANTFAPIMLLDLQKAIVQNNAVKITSWLLFIEQVSCGLSNWYETPSINNFYKCHWNVLDKYSDTVDFSDFKRIQSFQGHLLTTTWCMIFLKHQKKRKVLPEEVKLSHFAHRYAISWLSGGNSSGLMLYNSYMADALELQSVVEHFKFSSAHEEKPFHWKLLSTGILNLIPYNCHMFYED